MKKRVFLYTLVLILIAGSCRQEKRYLDESTVSTSDNAEIAAILKWQHDLNTTFKNPDTSPLPDRFRKDFETLAFYEVDTAYVVTAFFERKPDAQPFLMPTTTDRKTKEVVYGIAHFELHGKQHQLQVYQTLDSAEDEEEGLFLPFMDETNGTETYGGGRYLDLKIPRGDSLIIDFNKAYNPYCVYNKKYSCPLVPRQNYLRTSVRAGVKDFQKP